MIDLEFLESLIRALDQSSLDSIEIERGGTRVRLAKTPPAAPPPPALGTLSYPSATPAGAPTTVAGASPTPSPEAPRPEETRNLVDVKSPMVGTFFLAPAPDAPPYVEVGSRVKNGDTLCIIEAMKLMNELESEVVGVIAEILVENAEPVEYGQVLFRVEPA